MIRKDKPFPHAGPIERKRSSKRYFAKHGVWPKEVFFERLERAAASQGNAVDGDMREEWDDAYAPAAKLGEELHHGLRKGGRAR